MRKIASILVIGFTLIPFLFTILACGGGFKSLMNRPGRLDNRERQMEQRLQESARGGMSVTPVARPRSTTTGRRDRD